MTAKWHFKPIEGGLDRGPNDAGMETIPGNPWRGLVRECVQNTTDAALYDNIPVRMRFSHHLLEAITHALF